MSVVAASPKSVPTLAPTPAMQLDANDFELRRLYTGQFSSKAVQAENVKAGQLFVAAGGDDADPEVVWSAPYDAKKNPGVLVHVLSMVKKKSALVNGDLTTFDFGSEDAPADANTTYNFMLALPEVDEDLPFKYLLTRSSTPAAKKIITLLVKNSINGPAHHTAFRIWTAQRESPNGKYWIAQVLQVEAEAKNVEIAEQLAIMTAGSSSAPSQSSRSDQPSI